MSQTDNIASRFIRPNWKFIASFFGLAVIIHCHGYDSNMIKVSIVWEMILMWGMEVQCISDNCLLEI